MVGHTSCYFVLPPYRCHIGFKNVSRGHRICASMSNDVGRIRLHVGVLCSHVHMKVNSRTPLWEKLLHVCKPCWSIVSRLATCCQGRQQPLWLWLQCVAKKWTGIKSWCPNYTPCKKVNGVILESLHLSVLLSSIFCTRDGPAIINIHWCFCRTNVQAMQHEWDICPLFSSSNGTFPRGVHYNHGS